MKPRAAPPVFPLPGHRNMRQVIWNERQGVTLRDVEPVYERSKA